MITKTFWDLLDHWLLVLGLGFLFFGTTAVAFWLGSTFGFAGIVGGLVASLALNAAAGVVFLRFFDRYQQFHLARAILSAVFFTLIACIVVLAGAFAVWFYGSNPGLVGMSFSFLIVWIVLVLIAGAGFFLVLLPQFDGHFFLTLKVSFRLAAENPRLAAIGLIGSLLLNATVIILVPGLGATILFQNNLRQALKRRYDWLEAHPETQPTWQELMANEIRLLSNRSIGSLLHPWK